MIGTFMIRGREKFQIHFISKFSVQCDSAIIWYKGFGIYSPNQMCYNAGHERPLEML